MATDELTRNSEKKLGFLYTRNKKIMGLFDFFRSKPLTPEEMANIEQIVEDAIKNNKIAVFSKSYCRKFVH